MYKSELDKKAAAALRYLIAHTETNTRAVAEGTGIAQPTISMLMTGKAYWRLDHVERFANFFGVRSKFFLEWHIKN